MFVSQRRGKVRVSIHARARRATTASSPASTDAMFQSTPARGGRPASVLLADPFFGSFNPRPRAAGDRPPPSDCGHDSSFNPRPRAAGDTNPPQTTCKRPRFNPRPRAAGDRACAGASRPQPGFNPRPRAAGDVDCVRGLVEGLVSIHARARRATGRSCDRTRIVCVSIHARARRATWCRPIPAPLCSSFNPRPRAAGD